MKEPDQRPHFAALALVSSGFGPVEIARIFRFGGLVLVSRADFPAGHAWIIARAFLDNAEAFAPHWACSPTVRRLFDSHANEAR